MFNVLNFLIYFTDIFLLHISRSENNSELWIFSPPGRRFFCNIFFFNNRKLHKLHDLIIISIEDLIRGAIEIFFKFILNWCKCVVVCFSHFFIVILPALIEMKKWWISFSCCYWKYFLKINQRKMCHYNSLHFTCWCFTMQIECLLFTSINCCDPRGGWLNLRELLKILTNKIDYHEKLTIISHLFQHWNFSLFAWFPQISIVMNCYWVSCLL